MTKTFCTFIQSTHVSSHYASPALSIYHFTLAATELASMDVYIYKKPPSPLPSPPPIVICKTQMELPAKLFMKQKATNIVFIT